MNQSENLNDYLDLWGFEDNFAVFKDSSLGFGLKLNPVDLSCWDEGKTNGLYAGLKNFLNSLPNHLDLQFVYSIDKESEGKISQHQKLIHPQASKIASVLAEDRTTAFLKRNTHDEVPAFSVSLFVRRPHKGKIQPKGFSLYKKEVSYQSFFQDQLNVEISQFRQTMSQMIGTLSSLGFAPKQMEATEVSKIVYDQWNPDRNSDLEFVNMEDCRDSLLFSDIDISKTSFLIGKTHYRLLSLKLMPENTYASMAQIFKELPFGSKVFLTINVPDQADEIKSLQSQRRIAFSMATGKKSGVSDLDSEAKFQDTENLLEEMISSGEKVYKFSFNVLLKAESIDELDFLSSSVLGKIRELNSAEAMEETVAGFDVFTEISVPNARSAIRSKKIKTTNLVHFLPVLGPWEGHTEASTIFRSRSDSMIKFDPFDSNLSNANQIISGGSGAGKSYLTNLILLQNLKENAKVYIVDIGGSYKKLVKNLGGEFIDLNLDNNLAINPFDLPKGESIPSKQKIKFLVTLVELMTKEDGDTGLKKFERSELETMIAQVYKDKSEPRLSHLQKAMESSEDESISRLGKILRSWCGDSSFGSFLDRPSTVNLSNPLISFDLKGLGNYPELQSICLYLITDLVWREMQADIKTKKFLVFDECWKLLQSESGVNFIAEVYRTLRKMNGSAIAISQTIDDFASSKAASAIMPNSAIKWLLMQRGADMEKLKKVLQLNDTEMALIASLGQKRGEFSEGFLMAGDNRAVVKIEATPLEYWFATTDPMDLSAIEEFKKDNAELNDFETLKALADKYPKGIRNSPQNREDLN